MDGECIDEFIDGRMGGFSGFTGVSFKYRIGLEVTS